MPPPVRETPGNGVEMDEGIVALAGRKGAVCEEIFRIAVTFHGNVHIYKTFELYPL